ncbi:MAG: hypothetical protein ACRD96_18280 [Bryobacteraceae bacterium]
MRRGQATLEYAFTLAGIIIPVTFALTFAAEMLWVWHSVVDYTRDGARYAATHCWQGGENVLTYMRTNVPLMIDMDQFQSGEAQIEVLYFAKDPDTGLLTAFECAGGECSTTCIPDAVSVRIASYEFRRFVGFLGLPPVPIPSFRASVPIESAGCDAEQGTCLP